VAAYKADKILGMINRTITFRSKDILVPLYKYIVRPLVEYCTLAWLPIQFTVADWLTHSPATLDVMGSRPNSDDFSEIYFLESIQSPVQRDLKWSVCHCRN